MPVVNIPIKILGQNHSHSRSNSSSSVDNDRQPPPQQQQSQQPQSSQQQQQYQQGPTVNTSNMFNGRDSGFPQGFHRSPIPEFGNFSSTGFHDDPEWPNFPSFPNFSSGFPNNGSNFSDFPRFGRDGGLSPNPQMTNIRRSPTPQSPNGTLRRNSPPNQAPQQQQQYHQMPQQQQQPAPQRQTTPPNTKPTSRPPSRTREPKETEVPERPAVIPLPYEKKLEKSGSRDSGKGVENLEDNIAKIVLGKDNCELRPENETDGDPSPLTSPITEGKPKRNKKLQRNQSVVDFNAKTIVALDKIELQVEQLRKKASELEMEKEQILRSLGEISVHNCMFKLEDCDREEIEAITDRLTKRTKTVQVVVETPRNEEQKKALDDASAMIEDVGVLIQSDIEKAKLCLQTYLNACSYEETAGATCQNFLRIIIQCAADDQKRIKRRLENLMSQIENAEKTKADLMDEESE